MHLTAIEIGFEQSNVGLCFYFTLLKTAWKPRILLLFVCMDTDKIEEVANQLEKTFDFTNLGLVQNHLGIKTETVKKNEYFISEETYTETIK